jgi:hypothetical protein
VNGLFQFLLNVDLGKFIYNSNSGGININDVPFLLSSQPFQNATLKTLEIIRCKHLQRNNQKMYHSLDLKGFIMPHMVPKLVSLFSLNNGEAEACGISSNNDDSILDVEYIVLDNTRIFNYNNNNGNDYETEMPPKKDKKQNHQLDEIKQNALNLRYGYINKLKVFHKEKKQGMHNNGIHALNETSVDNLVVLNEIRYSLSSTTP